MAVLFGVMQNEHKFLSESCGAETFDIAHLLSGKSAVCEWGLCYGTAPSTHEIGLRDGEAASGYK